MGDTIRDKLGFLRKCNEPLCPYTYIRNNITVYYSNLQYHTQIDLRFRLFRSQIIFKVLLHPKFIQS